MEERAAGALAGPVWLGVLKGLGGLTEVRAITVGRACTCPSYTLGRAQRQ